MSTFGRTGRQNGILHRRDAAGHQVWTHLSWVRLMEPSLITQKTSSPPHPVTRLQSVAPGKVCRGNPEFSGLRRLSHFVHWVVVDHSIYAFHARIPVPPPLAVTSRK